MKKLIALVLAIMLCFVVGCDGQSIEEYNKQVSEYNATIENDSSAETSSTESKINNDAATSSVITFTDEEIMVMQFEELGLTNAEAEEAQKIFANVGITQISNITETMGSSAGIDGEQRYVCWFYDFNPNVDCIKLSFNIVKRKVQRISICFSTYGKLGEYPASHKYKELNLLDSIQEDTYSDSVTLYYKKLKNCAVDENSVGYRAIYDRETHSISKYK